MTNLYWSSCTSSIHQFCGSALVSFGIRIRRPGILWTKILKLYGWKNYSFFIKKCNTVYLSLSLHKGCPLSKPWSTNLQPSKESIFFAFLFLWVIFAHMNPNPDPVTKIKADLCGSGSITVDTLIKRKEIYTSDARVQKVIFEKRANEKEPFH